MQDIDPLTYPTSAAIPPGATIRPIGPQTVMTGGAPGGVKDARAWPPEITGRLKAYDLRPGDVIVIELDRDISRADAEKIKAIVKETFPGHDVMIVVGRMRVFRGDDTAADLDT